MSRAGHPSRVVIAGETDDAKRAGLLMDSVVMTVNLATVHLSEIDRVIRTLPRMTVLDSPLRATLGT